MTDKDLDIETEVIAETDNFHYQVWRAEEPDGEMVYHLEINSVTIHFFAEEWQEFLKLIKQLK